MGIWGTLIVFFVGMWVCQLIFTLKQMKHFRLTMNEMRKQASGFLGVGVQKTRFSVGAVSMVTTDTDGIITQCKSMKGVTVFARLQPTPEKIGKHIDACFVITPTKPEDKALNMAIENIRSEQLRKQQIKQIDENPELLTDSIETDSIETTDKPSIVFNSSC
ncbi:transcriptional regulator GutM [Brevibacillus daliensis]|uniref:transcriptional regulator GutM n=1 Tax=Brevibacillus daliensis TaxID=2892995 RepID=UPI001E2C97DC|nr:transcriptional regulator GutM [Brevibacillus daliensis]